MRHDGDMVDCNVVSLNPDYESIICDLASCTLCCFLLLFYFQEPKKNWWRPVLFLRSPSSTFVVWLSVEIADCMWFVSLTGLVRRTDWNQLWLECPVIWSVSRYESAVITLHRKEKCFFCYHFQILHTEINSWFNVFWMSDTVWWRSCRHWRALFKSLSTFIWQCEGYYWIIFFWQELRYSCFSCF